MLHFSNKLTLKLIWRYQGVTKNKDIYVRSQTATRKNALNRGRTNCISLTHDLDGGNCVTCHINAVGNSTETALDRGQNDRRISLTHDHEL